MRPIALVTIFAGLAVPAAAAAADDKSSSWIRVQQLATGGAMVEAGKEKWIEIQGWDWEIETPTASASPFKGEIATIEPTYDTGGTAKVDGFTVKQGVKPARPGPSDLTLKRGIAPRTKGPSHADKFGRVRVKFAWDACAEGRRLGSVELRDGRTHQVLEDVTILRCAPDGTTFAYARSRQSPAR